MPAQANTRVAVFLCVCPTLLTWQQESYAQEGDVPHWFVSQTLYHLAGYADVRYSDTDSTTDAFDQLRFNPIFHYFYKDLMLLEAELEAEIEPDGETEVALEYSSLNLFLNDYMILAAGKFLSPLGYFRENLHPSWINKLPAVPPGFGGEQAAPASEIGVQLRGAFPVGATALNYAVFVGNGPEVVVENTEVVAIATEGFTRDVDGDKVYGGRLGFLPIRTLEFGISGATGEAAAPGETGRDYDVLGGDASYHWRQLDLRGEYIEQDLGDQAQSVAPEGGEWSAWYVQAAYLFSAVKVEPILRYGEFDAPPGDLQQWAIGLNYLFAPNIIAKAAYEFNDAPAGTPEDDDRVLLQLAYGF